MSEASFYTTFINHFGLIPSQCQGELIHLIEKFARLKESKKLFIINGYAGTGKTSVLAAFVKTLRSYKVDTILMAPTGRAAKVFSLKAEKEAFTIHKQIYRRKSKVDISSGMSLQPNLYKNTFFIVDEASMIGDYTLQKDGLVGGSNLLQDLFEFVYSGQNCSLLLMGDDGQLPPVGSDFSPALSVEYLENHYPSIQIFSYKLTEVLRQSEDSEILRNATILRSTIWEDYPRLDVSRNSDLVRLSGIELQDALESSYDRNGSEEVILITRSNKQANGYNQQIRSRILWHEELLCVGDSLMVVKNNYYWVGDDSKMGFIANGEIVKVIRILKTEEVYGFEFARVIVNFIDYAVLGDVELIIHLESLSTEGPSLSRERLKELFYSVEQDYAHITLKKKRYEAILGDPYFNALQVKYAYAVTCHKSQGGQWKEVYIDQGYISEEILGPDYYRWLYTALTRATEKVYLLNFSDEFFTDLPV